MGVPDRPGPAAPRLLAELRRRAAERCPRIVFPETEDPRVLEAAAAVHREGIGRPILLGGRTFELAAKDLGAVENILIPGDPRREEIAGLILEKRRHRGMTEEEALERAGEPLLFGAGLVALGAAMRLGLPYAVALLLTAALLLYEHRLVRPDDLSRVDVAFFNINSYISLTLFLGVVAALWLR